MNIHIIPAPGCEVFAVLEDEKTAAFDCGMFYMGADAADRIEKALNGKPLDYIFITHSHFDHIGGIPEIRKKFPGVCVVASEKCAQVLSSETARKFMQKMSKDACKELMGYEPDDFDESLLYVDKVVHENDVISLGQNTFRVIETPGHTKCCLSYYSPEAKILFASESTGCYRNSSYNAMDILTGYDDAVSSIAKCSVLDVQKLFSSHFGYIEGDEVKVYFENATKCLEERKDIILANLLSGMSDEEAVKRDVDKYWTPENTPQSRPAFTANSVAFVKLVRREFIDNKR